MPVPQPAPTSALSAPSPLCPAPPGADAPPPCEVPHFPPVRVRGGRYSLRRLVRSRRRAVALGLAVTAAALVAAGPMDQGGRSRGHGAGDPPARTPTASAGPVRRGPPAEPVSAPVRIADAATVRLLRPGDRVDVIAAEQRATEMGAGAGTRAGTGARVVARGAVVTRIPEAGDAGDVGEGALVVLSVPRSTAVRLVGAGTTARLAVALW
ncbi:RcpC/CpaB family pilus assembly protein [Streptomyces longwoodensis]|uniref:RcpC/CpaB family pilus assembly protein n=1 Tax=Streptomyces longwoodensis TaxID=68231 RepID=UPI003869E2B4